MRYRDGDNTELRKSDELFRLIAANVTDVIWTSEFEEPLDPSHLLGQAAAQPGHYGLEGIRERARLFGGQATTTSTPGGGTRLTVEVPVAAPPVP